MKEIRGPAPTARAFESALSKEAVPSLLDKTTAVALNVLASGEKLSSGPLESIPVVAEALDNPEVVALLRKSGTLLTVLKTIQSSGGTVEKIKVPHDVNDDEFADILQAAPRLREVGVPASCRSPRLWVEHLNKETLEHLEAYPQVGQYRETDQTLGPGWTADELSKLKGFDQLKFLSLDVGSIHNLGDLCNGPQKLDRCLS